jgi:hypothetical protein
MFRSRPKPVAPPPSPAPAPVKAPPPPQQPSWWNPSFGKFKPTPTPTQGSMLGLGKNPGINSTNSTTTADMTRKSNAKPFSSALGGLGMALGKKMGMKEGGKVSSASKRADGCAVKGKTKGKMI